MQPSRKRPVSLNTENEHCVQRKSHVEFLDDDRWPMQKRLILEKRKREKAPSVLPEIVYPQLRARRERKKAIAKEQERKLRKRE